MTNLLKISDAATIALHAMVMLSDSQTEYLSVHDIAKAMKVSEHHLAKIGQRLVKADLVKSHRGPSGGFQLAKPPQKITLLEIFEAIEGPFSSSGCLFGLPVCGRESCICGGLFDLINKEFYMYFHKTTLDKIREMPKKEKKNANKKNN
jgi:Rrf2 family protein